jgi:serine/threonine protein kinase
MSTVYVQSGVNYKVTGIGSNRIFREMERYVALDVKFLALNPDDAYSITVQGEEIHLDYTSSIHLRNSIYESTNLYGINTAGIGPKLHNFFCTLDQNYVLCTVLELDYVDGVELLEVVNNSDLNYTLHTDFLRDFGAIVLDVAVELQRVHEMGLAHRDLKHDNIIVRVAQRGETRRYNGEACLIDYGVSRPFRKGFTSRFTENKNYFELLKSPLGLSKQKHTKKNGFGHPNYAAPEMARGEVFSSAKADIFSLGIILLESLLQKFIFVTNSYTQMSQFSRKDTNRLLDSVNDTYFPLTRAQRCAVKFAIDRSVIVEPEDRSLDAIIYASKLLQGE